MDPAIGPPGGPPTVSPTEPAGVAPSRPRRGYWIPAVIAMTVLVVMAILFGAGDLDHQAPSHLVGSDVDSQIALGLQARYGYDQPPTVHCPASEPDRTGRTFTCSARIGSETRTVHVTETNDRGQLQWNLSPGA